MSKRRVAPEDKRIIISARVTREEKDTLMQVGDGNISRGLDRIMCLWTQISEVASRPRQGDAASQPTACV